MLYNLGLKGKKCHVIVKVGYTLFFYKKKICKNTQAESLPKKKLRTS